MVSYIAFDFDGTIADTFEVVREEGNKILARYNIVINAEEARQIGLRKTILKSGFPILHVPKCYAELRRNVDARLVTDVRTFSGINDVIKALAQNHTLMLISSSSEANTKEFLKNNGILSYFEVICSDRSLFRKHRVLKRLSKKYHIEPDEFLYIGDEDRDVQAAKRIKIKNIAVSWGYNTAERLREVNPEVLVNNIQELKDAFALLNVI